MLFIILLLCVILLFGQFWVIGIGLAFLFSIIYLMKYAHDQKILREEREEELRILMEDPETRENLEAHASMTGSQYSEYLFKSVTKEKVVDTENTTQN